VIARNDYDLQTLNCLNRLLQYLIEKTFCGSRRIGIIKNVARHNHCIGLVFAKLSDEPVKEVVVFRQAVVAVKYVSKVPIGGVKDKHGGKEK
jgi:hypothetical protein